MEDLLTGLQCDPKGARQFHHRNRQNATCMKISSSDQCELDCAVKDSETVDLRLPIKRLDQVFFQAKCINPIFLKKVQSLALATSGGGPVHFSVSSEGNSVPCAEGDQHLMGSSGFVFKLASQGEGAVPVDIRWGSIKSVNRSIEKVIRVYKGVSSYLEFSSCSLLLSHIRVETA
jgi:hypothetical protein